MDNGMNDGMDDNDDAQPLLPMAIEPPIAGLVVDCGSQRRKHIERLKRGEGKLTRRIQAAVFQARQTLGIDAATEIVPVILLYRETEASYVVVTAEPVGSEPAGAVGAESEPS